MTRQLKGKKNVIVTFYFFLFDSHLCASPSLTLPVWATCIIYLHPRSPPACLAAAVERCQDPMTVHKETVTHSRGGVNVVRQELQPGEIIRPGSENHTNVFFNFFFRFASIFDSSWPARVPSRRRREGLNSPEGPNGCQLHRTLLGSDKFELDSESSFVLELPLWLADSQTCPPLSPGHRAWHSSDIITGSFHPESLEKENKTKHSPPLASKLVHANTLCRKSAGRSSSIS